MHLLPLVVCMYDDVLRPADLLERVPLCHDDGNFQQLVGLELQPRHLAVHPDQALAGGEHAR